MPCNDCHSAHSPASLFTASYAPTSSQPLKTESPETREGNHRQENDRPSGSSIPQPEPLFTASSTKPVRPVNPSHSSVPSNEIKEKKCTAPSACQPTTAEAHNKAHGTHLPSLGDPNTLAGTRKRSPRTTAAWPVLSHNPYAPLLGESPNPWSVLCDHVPVQEDHELDQDLSWTHVTHKPKFKPSRSGEVSPQQARCLDSQSWWSMPAEQAIWFESQNLSSPKMCQKCREYKKTKKKQKKN